jgi:hypothetical protein
MAPTKLTPELQVAIVADIEAGNAAETAAVKHGVSRSTFYGWLARGRADEEPYVAFAEAVERARATAESRIVQCLVDATPKDWRASEAWLRRRNPSIWEPAAVALHEAEVKAEAAKAVKAMSAADLIRAMATTQPEMFWATVDGLERDDDIADEFRSTTSPIEDEK